MKPQLSGVGEFNTVFQSVIFEDGDFDRVKNQERRRRTDDAASLLAWAALRYEVPEVIPETVTRRKLPLGFERYDHLPQQLREEILRNSGAMAEAPCG